MKSFVEKHKPQHTCCLVGAQPGPEFRTTSEIFLNNIRPYEIISIPGLNTRKLFGLKWQNGEPPFLKQAGEAEPIPYGNYKNKNLVEVVQTYEKSKFAALLYGSNNRNYFESEVDPFVAFTMFFDEIKKLFEKSNFESLFISTIFPGSRDINRRGEYVTTIKNFNEILLSRKTRTMQKFVLKTVNQNKIERTLHWTPIDMTDSLKYNEINHSKYFCSKNSYDKIHFNKKYSQIFFEKLDESIKNYIYSQHKNKNKRKKRKIEEIL